MPTLAEWRSLYDGWAGRDPRLASTGDVRADAEFDRLAATLRGWLGLRGDETALDVGCASGTLTSRWAVHTARTCGVDYSPRLCAEAQRRHGGDRLAFANAEISALPFPDASFDAVACYNVLLSMPDHDYVRAAIAELLRVARPDATVVLGSLPDARRQQRFFELLRARAPWPRRVAGRVKDLLLPARERRTMMLWFDVEALAAELRGQGWQVACHDDPPFADYRYYRQSLVLTRGARRPR